MTSNIGSHIIQERFEGVNEDNLLAVTATTRIEVMEMLRKTIRPEFLNRIDEIIMFKPLLRSEIRGVVEIQLHLLADLLAERDIKLKFTPALITWLADEGFDPQFGARPLKRVIQKEIVNTLSKRILAGEVTAGSGAEIEVDVAQGDVVFRNVVG